MPHTIGIQSIVNTALLTLAVLIGIPVLTGCGTEVDASANANPEIANTPGLEPEDEPGVGRPAADRPGPKQDPELDNQESKPAESKAASQTPKSAPEEPQWIGKPITLLENDSLDGWETLNFGGEGDCEVKSGILLLEAGDPFTGVSSTLKNLPETNYEISLTARKTQGIDFFCGLTFPVAKSHCSLIVGGWGGGLVGLSCIDDLDASSNDTQSIMKFNQDQWYKIRVRVQPERISAWIDDKQVVNQDIVGKKISLRGDFTLSRPLGVCSFQTDAEIKNIQLRRFKPMPLATSKQKMPSSNLDADQ